MTFGWHSIQWYMALRPWVPLLKHLNIILKSKLESRVLKRKLISSINYPSHGFALNIKLSQKNLTAIQTGVLKIKIKRK